MPKQDVFSYTYAGAEWINIKWGFEVLAAVITHTLGAEFIFLLQAIVVCAILFILLKSAALYLTAKVDDNPKHILFAIACLFVLLASEYRFNGRPEMFSHLFAVVFLFLLLNYRNENSNRLFWLIPLQILWANMHEAFGMGIVMIGVFVVAAWMEYVLTIKQKLNTRQHKPLKITMLLLGAVLGLMLNPNGVKLLTRPFSILNQVYENKFSTELLDFSRREFWQFNSYVAVAIVLVTAIGVYLHFRNIKSKESKLKLFVEHFGIGYLLLLPAFLYLALTAYRNIIFLALITFPLFVFALHALWARFKVLQSKANMVLGGVSVIGLLLYGTVVSNKYYELTGSHDKFGLQVFTSYNPVGAANFIHANHIAGPFFSDYLTSSYLLYALQPDFKTFIDLRDLDVFPSEFFNKYATAITYPEEFVRLDSAYRFNCIVLYRPQFAAIHSYLNSESRFKLAYADAVACVFIPKKDSSEVSPAVFSALPSSAHGNLSTVVNHVLNPLFKGEDADNDETDYLAAAYFTTIGRLDAAEDYAKRSALSKKQAYKGLEVLGEVYYNRALQATTKEEKMQLLSSSASYYNQALAQQSDYAPAYLGLGAVYFQQQNITTALDNFDKCLSLDKENLNANIFAAECCKYFINLNNNQSSGYVERAIDYYRTADKINPHNPTIELNLGFLYFRQNNCDKATQYLKNLVDYPGLSPQERQQAKGCLQKCGG
ncbi:MAG: hypothetical protein U0V74_12885 [Chitinophagales bacterium]